MSDLKKLFEASVLTDETKEVLQEAFDTAVKAKEEELNLAYEAKLVEAKAEIAETVSKLVEESVANELEAIAEEVNHARTLEVQYAEKLQEFKESYAEKQEEKINVLVAEMVAEEIDELKNDIETAKKHEFVMSVYESFADVYAKLFGGNDINIHDQLAEAKKELDALKHEKKLNELLENFSGKKRDVARTILESVPTEKLDSKFESIRGLLVEEVESDEKEKVVSESNTDEKKEVSGKVVMENVEETPNQDKEIDNGVLSKLERSIKFARGK